MAYLFIFLNNRNPNKLFKNDSCDFTIVKKVVGGDTDHGGSPRLVSPPTATW